LDALGSPVVAYWKPADASKPAGPYLLSMGPVGAETQVATTSASLGVSMTHVVVPGVASAPVAAFNVPDGIHVVFGGATVAEELSAIFERTAWLAPYAEAASATIVIGVARAKELLAQCMHGRPGSILTSAQLPPLIPERMKALDAVERLREEKSPFALVVDEYGIIAGMLTFADVLEAIVGDIPGRCRGRARCDPAGGRVLAAGRPAFGARPADHPGTGRTARRGRQLRDRRGDADGAPRAHPGCRGPFRVG